MSAHLSVRRNLAESTDMHTHITSTDRHEPSERHEISEDALELASIGCLIGIVMLLAAAMAGLWMRLPA